MSRDNKDNPFTGFGPFQNMFQPFDPSSFSAPMGFDQIMRGMTRWQLEAQQLMARRAQAYLELPGRMSQCRTPQDLMQEQTQFWQAAFQQYSESSRRILSAWSQAAQPASAEIRPEDRPKQRDYLSFAEQARAREQANGSAGGKRRVA
jgi:hypothetical protein